MDGDAVRTNENVRGLARTDDLDDLGPEGLRDGGMHPIDAALARC